RDPRSQRCEHVILGQIALRSFRPPNGSGAHPRGAFMRRRQSGTAVAATNDSFGRSELQLP
ncbi:MAG TPA: hypothetical protein VI391_08765, partial [Thermoanaerobaculia bacterium]